jgi:hypothetical protein
MLLSMGGLPVAATAPADLGQIVASHYPTVLSAALAEDGDDTPANRQQSYVPIAADGMDYIVAAYSNRATGAVVLLQKKDGSYVDVQEIAARLGEREPHVDAVDVDADGIPEAVVTYEYGMRSATEAHIYRLAHGQLQLISPTDGDGNSIIGFPRFLDINGNGVLDLENDRWDSVTPPVVVKERYTLQNGKYAAAQPFDFCRTFYRGSGKPVTDRANIAIPQSLVGKPFRLVIVNGGSSGEELRVSAATISLNGATIANQSNFSQQSSSVSVPVSLQQTNVLGVMLDGKPSSRVTIIVRHD